MLAATCGGSPPASDGSAAPTAAPTTWPSLSAAPATGVVPATEPPSGTPTDSPAASPSATFTESPAASPTETPTDDPSASTPTGRAEACTGTDENRAFFDAIANAVDWPVLCGVMRKGWYLQSGRYRTGNGGWVYVEYAGPGGATLRLDEGSSCAVNGGCDTGGTDLGPAALGPLDGTLLQTGTGFAVVAAPGERPMWYLATTGLDQATTVQLAAALAEVGP